MKRNFLMAIVVTAFMLATTIAQAADISFSGQFRPRFQINNDSTDNSNERRNFTTRARLNAKANVNANTEVFLQFQSIGTWGNAGTSSGSRRSAGGSDAVDDVGLHQAFLTLKNFAGQPVDAKIGRQEVVLDGHRLFGHTGWTDGAQTNDAIRLNHSAGNHTLNAIYIAAIENEAENTTTSANSDIYILRGATQGVLGGDLTGMFVIAEDNSAETDFTDPNTWYTIGARQKGKLAGLDYRVEFYHQFGDGATTAVNTAFCAAYTTCNDGAEIDRNAQMFGVRVGKTFKNVKYTPTVTLWYDELSGTDDTDVADNDMGTFNTLQDTGHKFYGLIDNFGGSAENTGTAYYGLRDIAIKTKVKLSDRNTLKVDLHYFETQTNLEDDDSATLRTNHAAMGSTTTGTMDGALGEEIDVTLVHKYDANTKIVAGYSYYFTTTAFATLNGGGSGAGSGANDDQDWMYVMLDTKF